MSNIPNEILSRFATIDLEKAKSDFVLAERFEFKYRVQPHQLEQLYALMYDRMLVTRGRQYRFVYHNIYYDTPDYLSFKHSLGSTKRRRRVRTYDTQDSFLEYKTKQNDQGTKERTPIKHVPDELVAEGRSLGPRVFTSYTRMTFVNPQRGLRMTIDSDLQLGAVGTQGGRLSFSIVEIKGSHKALSEFHTSVIGHSFPKTSFSKCEYAVRQSLTGQFLFS